MKINNSTTSTMHNSTTNTVFYNCTHNYVRFLYVVLDLPTLYSHLTLYYIE
eukprot:m.25130 g.25130  ORF g.25130 m.25130 type:complete len:51 (+) comp14886_c0_seq1:1073-1225(+)